MVIIVTGTTGIGKTTVCQKVIEMSSGGGYICGGVITSKRRNGDILIEDIKTGETRILASTKYIYQGPHTGKYYFNPEGIDFGIQAIDRGTIADILIVDELGHLELRGQGFARVVEKIATGKIKNWILVIRKELLSSFLPRLGVATTVFEATPHSRNQLPRKICLALKRTVME
jgi:nucleoside-triphosphatase THEP1